MNPLQALISRAAQSPALSSNPNARSMLEVVQSGDASRGEQIANNLLKTYGVSKEDALAQAKRFFNL